MPATPPVAPLSPEERDALLLLLAEATTTRWYYEHELDEDPTSTRARAAGGLRTLVERATLHQAA